MLHILLQCMIMLDFFFMELRFRYLIQSLLVFLTYKLALNFKVNLYILFVLAMLRGIVDRLLTCPDSCLNMGQAK